jgi:hypothetical protein
LNISDIDSECNFNILNNDVCELSERNLREAEDEDEDEGSVKDKDTERN